MQTVESSSPTTTSSIPGAGFQTQPHTHPNQQQQQRQQQQQQQQQQQLLQQQQSASRRLLARFTSGLGSKPRSVGDFTIHLDEHHRHYSNGDTVKGHVRLQVLRPIKITHIVISLAGLAQVYKNPGSNNENGRVAASLLSGSGGASGRARTAGRYHGNGVATLFEDEVILCGDGRLGERTYQFNFELQFPDKQLPSSIDFERGTISYVITATMTRPTTISPTTATECNVNFVERIDIARLYPPKSRTIILDPISKRSKAKSQAKKVMMEASDRKMISRSKTIDFTSSTISARPSSSSQEGERALSPVPSEVSEESRVSSNGVASQNGSIATSPSASFVGRTTHSKNGFAHKTISTEIQPCVGGCLRGDHVAVNIKVNHSKYVKSMNGVIVTLYRTARVDTQPALAVGLLDGTKRSEEYFSRSLTGLGGLSLSGTGPAHVFRKDLAQVIMPLVINPTTLTAELVAKLRVPEEAFPTIAGLPGAMISFKYYLEVMVDIQGRLAGADKLLSSRSELTSTTLSSSDAYETDWTATTSTGQSILNTTYVRRDKGVVSASFELVIGTIDSERRKGKQKAETMPEISNGYQQAVFAAIAPPPPSQHPPAFDSILGASTSTSYLHRSHSHLTAYSARTPDAYEHEHWPDVHGYAHHTHSYPPPSTIAPPQLPDESQLTEKERMQLAETRLLPSQPPGIEDTGQTLQRPTAPRIAEDGTLLEDAGGDETPAPRDEYATDSTESTSHINQHVTRTIAGPSSSSYHSSSGAAAAAAADSVTNSVSPATDDKQELERSRLQALASAPPADPDEIVSNGYDVQSESTSSALAVADDVSPADVHDSHAEASGSADLPRYEG